jgi:hypothetical protein
MKIHLLKSFFFIAIIQSLAFSLFGQIAPTTFTNSVTGTTITLTWNASATGGVDGLVIRARIAGGTFPTLTQTSEVDLADGAAIYNTTNTGQTLAPFTNAVAGAQYEFEIYAYDNQPSTSYSITPNTTTAYTLAVDPGAEPGGFAFTATPTSSQINLSFTAPSAWSASGYILYRQAGGAPAGSSTDGNAPAGFTDYYAIITGSGTTTYSDVAATVGTSYTYALVPFNVGLDGSLNPIPETYNYGAVGSITPSATIPPTATVATNNGALGNIIGGETNEAIFGFRAQTNGTQSINNVVFTITTTATLADILTTFVLKDDGTNTTYTGAGATLGAVNTTGPVSNVYTLTFDLTGAPVALSGTDKYFYLAANSPGATAGATGIQAALTTVGVTAGVASSLTGFNRTFDVVPITATVATNNGVLGNVIGGETNEAIFGFRAQTNGTQSINNVVFTITTTATLSDILTTLVLKDDATNTTYSGAGTALGTVNTTGPVTNVYTLTFDLSGSPVALSGTDKYFYLAANAPGNTAGATGIQAALTTVGVTAGVASSLTGFNRTFDVVPLVATIATNNGALANVAGGETIKPIFGFSAQTNGTQSINNVVFTITTTATLSDILSTFVLKDDATNTTYGGAGATLGTVNTTGPVSNVYTLTFDLTGAPVALSVANKYFYLIANVPGATLGATGVQAALTTVGVTAGNPSSLTGFNRTFDVVPLTATIVTNNGALGNLIGSETNEAIFGFSATTNGTQSINNVVFTITTTETLANILSSIVLKDDATNATYSGAGATLGTINTTGPVTNVYTLTFDLTGSPVALSGVSKYFYLVANAPASAPATTGIQAALTTIGVTAGNPSSLTGFNRTFDIIRLTATVATNNGGLGNLIGSNTNRAIFGFRAATNGTQSINNVVFTITTTQTLANILSSIVLKDDATNTTYSGAGATLGTVNTTGPVTNVYTLTFDLSGSPVALSAANKYFYLAANVPDDAPATTGIQVALTTVGANNGDASSLAGFNRSFDIIRQTATLTAINGGTAPVQAATLLEAGETNKVLAGFSIASNGSQILSSINFNLSGLTAGQFSSVRLFRTTTVGVSGSSILTDPNSDGNFDLSGVAAGDKTINTGTPVYYYLVVGVLNTVTSVTATYPNVRVNPTETNVVFTAGDKNTLTIDRTFTFTQSDNSDIILNGGNQADILMADANTSDETPGTAVTTGNSSILATFTLRDGGAADDLDDLPTVLDQLTISIENFENLDQIALFDQGGTKISGTDKTPAATVTWTGLNYATTDDRSAGANGTRNFTIRATFKTNVIDNQQTDIDIVATTSAAGTGSLFAATNAGGNGTTGTANHNRIEVDADRLIFAIAAPTTNPVSGYTGVQFASVTGQTPDDLFDVFVVAVDANNNRDLDETSNITLTIDPNSGVQFRDNGIALVATPLSQGYVTFTDLTVDVANAYDIEAFASGLTDALISNSRSLQIVIQSAGVGITSIPKDVCITLSSSAIYEDLPDIIIDEANNADFGTGTGFSFLLILPSGWEFDTTVPGLISMNALTNITLIDNTFSFLGNTIAKFTYTVSGVNRDDIMTLSGLKIRNVGGIDGVITRGGTGVIKGCCDDAKNLGELNTLTSDPIDFSVQESPGEPVISPTTLAFPRTSKPVILNGQAPPGTIIKGIGTFTGSSITEVNIPEDIDNVSNPSDVGDRFTFNPNILTAGNYDVTYAYSNVDGCVSELTKTFEVYEGGINGLAVSYCADDIGTKVIKVNNTFRPADAQVVIDPVANDTAFSLRIPTYKYVRGVVNETDSLTLFVKNHGLVDGNSYWMYIANFVQETSPGIFSYSYAYDFYQIDVLNPDQIKIIAVSQGTPIVGAWDNNYGIVYLPDNYYQPFNGATNAGGGNVNITSTDHGFVDGARPYMYIEFYDATFSTYYYYEGFFTVSNSSAANPNTFTVTIPGLDINAVNFNYGYAYTNWYRITTFKPAITLLNRKLTNVTSYDVGYFLKYNWCTYQGCDVYYTIHETPVQLNPLPVISFAGLATEYCNVDNAVTLTGSEASRGEGTFSITAGSGSPVITNNAGTGTATFDPQAQPTDVSLSIKYEYTSNAGCVGEYSQTTLVKSQLVPPALSDSTICQIAGSTRNVFLNAKAAGSVVNPIYKWYNTASPTPSTAPLGIGVSYDSKVSESSSGTSQFYVTQETPTTCQSTTRTVTLLIQAQPNATLSPPTICEDRQFTIDAPGGSNDYDWYFTDTEVSATPTSYLNQPSNSINHTFINDGIKSISLTVTKDYSGLLCSNSYSTSVTVNPNPEPSFTYEQVCEGDATEFIGTASGGTITDFAWDFYYIDPSNNKLPRANFGKTPAGNTAPLPFTGTAQNPLYILPDGSGDYEVTLVAYNNLGCFDSLTRVVTVLDTLIRNTTNPYIMAAEESGKGYWRVLDNNENSTWEFDVVTAAKPLMQSAFGANAAWVTNNDGTYAALENSSVNSPCFNIQNIVRPVLTMSFAMEIEALANSGSDGAALEYSTDGGITWLPVNVGPTNPAVSININWFNYSSFASSPIGESQVGWSGNSTTSYPLDNPDQLALVDGRHALDNLPGLPPIERDNVRFRVAFKSTNVGEYEGFGFQNFKIESRNRLLLTEHFTNENDPEYTANQNLFTQIDPVESASIQYHVGSPPSGDANSLINKEDQNARAAFYGVALTESNIPRAYIDGFSRGPLFTNDPQAENYLWAARRNFKRALVPAEMLLTVESLPFPGVLDSLKVQVTIDPLNTPWSGIKPVLHVALVEESDAAGNEFVLRKLAGSPVGRPLQQPLAGPITEEFNVAITENLGFDISNLDLVLVAFVQDEITKEVYQAAVDLTPDFLPTTVITKVEDPEYANKINLYPNPANQELQVVLPAPVAKPTLVNMIDAFGKVAHQLMFNSGEQQKTIRTTEFTAGVYIVQIGTPEGGMVYRKVVITH